MLYFALASSVLVLNTVALVFFRCDLFERLQRAVLWWRSPECATGVSQRVEALSLICNVVQ